MELPQNFSRIGNGAIQNVAGITLSVKALMPRLHERRTFHASAFFSNVNRLWLRVGYVAAMLTEEWTSCDSRNCSILVFASRQIYPTLVVMAQLATCLASRWLSITRCLQADSD